MINPKISIIIPVFNSEKYIHICLDSVLSQTFKNYECIIINDCSSDNSGKILDEYSRKDERIKIINNKENKGSSLSRRIGFEMSSGEFIQFVDSDDWIAPDTLEKLYNKAISEDCDLLIFNVSYIDKDNNIKIIKQDHTSSEKIYIIRKIIYNEIKTYLFNKFIKRELLSIINFPVYSKSEDYYITIQYIYNAEKICYIDDYLYYYRYNETSLTNNNDRKIKSHIEENKNWCLIIEYLKEKYIKLNIFEPLLSNRINKLKYLYSQDKDLKDLKELFYIYPESGFFRWQIYFYIKSLYKKLKKI